MVGRLSRRNLLKIVPAGAIGLAQEKMRSPFGSTEQQDAEGSASGHALDAQDELERLGDSVAIRGSCDGIPIYGFGYTYIYRISPDFISTLPMQAGTRSKPKKLQPKRSWEISANLLGATPPREPRTARTDPQPFLGVSLIDGDPDTYWSCRGQCRSDVEPAWIRIDLPVETRVKNIVLIPRRDGLGIPGNLTIKVSRDAWHWEIVYENADHGNFKDVGPQSFDVGLRPVKQLWIIGSKLPLLGWFYSMSIAEIEVISESGDNVALFSRGASVEVSSCDFGITSEREMHQMLWGVHFDLGVKWVRVGYAGPGALNWNFVERTKGKYEIDPETYRAITQMVKNGVSIVLCLAFTNWLYSSKGRMDPKESKHLWEGTEMQSSLPSPGLPGMLEGYLNFVRFMVRHFRDRVRYYEIWNEESGNYGGLGDTKLYTEYVRRTVPIIRSEYPDAKIVLGSVSGFGARRELGITYLENLINEGLIELVDGIGWHPCYSCDPAENDYLRYPDEFKKFKQFAESRGFRGEYLNTEWDMFASYPVAPQYTEPSSSQSNLGEKVYSMIDPGIGLSELVKAKHSARFAVMNAGLGIISFWNETWSNTHIDRDVGLFRNGFSMAPINPTQPQPVYYTMRTLSTVLEGAIPGDLRMDVTGDPSSFEIFKFELPHGDRLVSVALSGRSRDDSRIVSADLTFPGNLFDFATGIDVLNGTEVELALTTSKLATSIRNLHVRDYPIMIRFGTKRNKNA